MPKCIIKGCEKFTRYINTKNPYCSMHLARIKRHGHPELQKDHHKLEKLPHLIVDDFIRNNCRKLIDIDVAEELKKRGFGQANKWLVRYRRRKLGIKKYLYGEVKKHKAWIRTQATTIYKLQKRCYNEAKFTKTYTCRNVPGVFDDTARFQSHGRNRNRRNYRYYRRRQHQVPRIFRICSPS